MEDHDLAPIIEWMECQYGPSEAELRLHSPATRSLWLFGSSLELQNGVLYYRWIDKPGRTCCLIVPDKLKEEVMHHCHLGQQKTIERVKQSFLWYRLGLDCTHYSFKVCNQNKRPNKHARDAISRFHAGYLMERVHLDILGLFNTNESGNRYALMMVDQFTKWVEMSTIPG